MKGRLLFAFMECSKINVWCSKQLLIQEQAQVKAETFVFQQKIIWMYVHAICIVSPWTGGNGKCLEIDMYTYSGGSKCFKVRVRGSVINSYCLGKTNRSFFLFSHLIIYPFYYISLSHCTANFIIICEQLLFYFKKVGYGVKTSAESTCWHRFFSLVKSEMRTRGECLRPNWHWHSLTQVFEFFIIKFLHVNDFKQNYRLWVYEWLHVYLHTTVWEHS